LRSGGDDSSYEIDKDDLSNIMNEEITQVQDTVLHEDTATYDEDSSMDGTPPATSLQTGQLGNTELSTMEPSPMDIQEHTELLEENSSMDGNVEHEKKMAKFSDYLGLDDCIGLMDWESSMDGTPPSTSPPYIESIDLMGDLLDPEQVDEKSI
jgi:hypothetical protein